MCLLLFFLFCSFLTFRCWFLFGLVLFGLVCWFLLFFPLFSNGCFFVFCFLEGGWGGRLFCFWNLDCMQTYDSTFISLLFLLYLVYDFFIFLFVFCCCCCCFYFLGFVLYLFLTFGCLFLSFCLFAFFLSFFLCCFSVLVCVLFWGVGGEGELVFFFFLSQIKMSLWPTLEARP